MTITTATIEYFKGIHSAQLVDLGKVNIFFGKNNSGKSTILQAIEMCGLSQEFNNWNQYKPMKDIKELFNEAGPFKVQMNIGNDQYIVEKSASSAPTQKMNTADYRKVPHQNLKTVLIRPDVLQSLSNNEAPNATRQKINSRDFGNVTLSQLLYTVYKFEEQNEKVAALGFQELKVKILAVFDHLDDFEVNIDTQNRPYIVLHEKGEKIDLVQAGSGIYQIMNLITYIHLFESNVVLLDEPETGLHPDIQRKFFRYIIELAETKNIQFFITSHSPIFLNGDSDCQYYRCSIKDDKREVTNISSDALESLFGDLGLRPSDFFNHDICLMVEGATEVIFFSHIIHELYKDEFKGISVGIVQYGGGAAEAIVSGAIKIENLVRGQKHLLWVHDKDSGIEELPSTSTTKLVNKLTQGGQKVITLKRREIEFYFGEEVLKAAQQDNLEHIERVIELYNGNQNSKFRDSIPEGACSPSGVYLRQLLKKYMTSSEQVEVDIKDIVGKLKELANDL